MDGEIRVLCVGCEESAADRITAALADTDDQFVVSRETDAGLARLASNSVDCALVDARTPNSAGFVALNDISEQRNSPPVVALASDETAPDAIAAGATDYFRLADTRDGILAARLRTVVESARASERKATLERIRSLVSEVNQALVHATSTAEIDSRVCEILSSAEPYRFAWVGEFDPETGAVEPREWGGLEAGYLSDITVTADDTPTGHGPGGKAVKNDEISVIQDIQNDPEFAPWRADALERGYQSLASVPLLYEGTHHGVLNVYADRTNAFDDAEMAVLSELGDDIAHALAAVEIRNRLAEEKERFRQLVTEVEEYAIFRLDPSGTVVSWNDGARQLKGYTREEILGEHFSMFYPDDVDSDHAQEVLDAAAERGSYEEEGWRVRKDGSRFWGSVTVTALRDDDGTLRGFTKITRDLTEQRNRERELRRFKRAVESAGQGVYITDTDGTIEYVNPAFEEITGYSRGEATGMTPRILKSGEMDDEYYEKLWRTLLAGDVWDAEITDRRRDGELYEAHQTIAPILDDGTVEEFVAIQSDITERKEREQQLRVLDRVLRHNLNNALNVIQARAEVIESDAPPQFATDAVDIVKKTNELVALVDKERAVTRVLLSDAPRQRLDVTELIGRVVKGIQPDYPDATITSDLPEGVTAEGTTQLNRAVTELLENALVHSDNPSPEVTVSVAQETETVSIAVKDDGPGIPEMERKVLLGEEELEPLYHGSGLGLWLVYWIVRQSGGTLQFSDNDPSGSVVTIELQRD
ncbi:MAG: PAS domain S-box protein [Haloarculaceae archaeon]